MNNNLDKFQSVLKETQSLMNKHKNNSMNEDEEFQLASCIKTLRILSRRIEDRSLCKETQEILRELGILIKNGDTTIDTTKDSAIDRDIDSAIDRDNTSTNTLRKRFTTKNSNTNNSNTTTNNNDNVDSLIQEEMLKNSIKLREKTAQFNATLKKDTEVVEKTKESLTRNTREGRRGHREILENKGFSTMGYFSSTLGILIGMWIIIRWI